MWRRLYILEFMQSVNVKLPSSTGTMMAGTIDFPDSAPQAFAIFAHCFAGSRHTPGAARVSKQLTNFGVATLRFDFPGLGQSEGNFAETSFSQNVADIQAAATWLAENYSAPQLLMGHSLGGAASLAAASGIRSLKAVATIGAPFDPAHSVLHYADKIGEVDANGEVEVTLGGRALTISRHFLEDLADTNPEEYLRHLRKPLMILHSPIDQTVGIDNAQNIFLKTRYPKSLVALDKADHLVTKQGLPHVRRTLSAHGSSNLLFQRTCQRTLTIPRPRHSLQWAPSSALWCATMTSVPADRTKKQGGKGQGFTAEGLLMSALATASTQSIKQAAKGMALDDVEVTVTHVHDKTFERRIELVGNLSTDEKAELFKAATTSEIEQLLGAAHIVDVHA